MSKNKNFVFAERVKLEHHLNCNLDVSAIKLAKILDRSLLFKKRTLCCLLQ